MKRMRCDPKPRRFIRRRRWSLRQWLGTLLLSALGWLTGCSAVASRVALAKVSSPPAPVYFAGVRTDFQILRHVETDDMGWMLPGCCVMDTPLSLGTDVLLLPYDGLTAYRWSQHNKTTSPPEPGISP